MKAFIHIGAPKTGSTSIQEFLKLNAEALAARGVHYDVASPKQTTQSALPMAAMASLGIMVPGRERQLHNGVPDLGSLRVRGEAEMSRLSALVPSWKGHTAIFSSEHIYAWLKSADAIRIFDSMMGEIFSEIRYILYIREQEGLILSRYSQNLKTGSAETLETFFDRMLDTLDLEKRVMSWADTVGRDRFDLRLMDPGFLLGGDLLADFTSACGISIEGLVRPPRLNESLTAAGSELLRALNARIPHILPEGSFNPLAGGLTRQVMAVSGPSAPVSLSQNQRNRLQTRVAAGNEALRATFFPDRPGIFSEREAPPAPEERPLAEALDMATRLIIRLRTGRWNVLPEPDRKRARQRPPTEKRDPVAKADSASAGATGVSARARRRSAEAPGKAGKKPKSPGAASTAQATSS